MAKMIQAVQRYGPRLVPGRTAGPGEVVEWLVGHSGLKRGQVMMVLMELHAAAVFFNHGSAISLPGLGLFTPVIRGDGRMRVSFRPDRALTRGLNAPGACRGDILHRDNIGRTGEQLKVIWDAEFPDDPLVLEESTRPGRRRKARR